jgi:hypothetical protein
VSQWLGFAGLLPFYAAVLGIAATDDYLHALSAQAFVIYGLGILCFLAGALWGMAQWSRTLTPVSALLVSNGVVVFAVAAVLTAQLLIASVLIALGFLAVLWFERSQPSKESVGEWYLPLRTQLTAGVLVAHVGYWVMLIQEGV